MVLIVAGIAAAVVGAIGLASDGGSTAAGPTGAVSPSAAGPTGAPTAEPTAEPTEEPSAEPTDEPTASPTEAPAETPEEFVAALGAAFASGDADFLFSRLHPYVLERYGKGQCRRTLAAIDTPDYVIELLGVEGDGPFVYETDGVRRRVDEATTVRVRAAEDGETFTESEAHIVLDGDRYRWFSDCGTPVAGAP